MSVTFTKGGDSAALPSPIPGSLVLERKHQAIGRTADGTIYTYDKGVAIYEVQLAFESLTDTEKNELQNFFHTTVNGAVESFTYVDSANNNFTARMIDGTLRFRKVAANVWDVSLRLEIDGMGA